MSQPDVGAVIGQTLEQMLREFHVAAGQVGGGFPSAEMRQEMLDSEVQELRDALAARDRVKVADALADIVYVVAGTAIVMGIPLDAVLAEVHRSNMTKLTPPIRLRDDGKILKGPAYEPPDIAGVLGAWHGERCSVCNGQICQRGALDPPRWIHVHLVDAVDCQATGELRPADGPVLPYDQVF